MIYDWLRLILGVIAIVPPLALTVLLLAWAREVAFRSVPTWLTWTQSLASVALFAGVIGDNAQAVALGYHVRSLGIEALFVGSYCGLGAIRWVLLVWWIRDWRVHHRRPAPTHRPA